jgi:uncharacterized caspase-like protein
LSRQPCTAVADRADWAVIYFAGHGLEINRINYLLPVDAKLADDRDVSAERGRRRQGVAAHRSRRLPQQSVQ